MRFITNVRVVARAVAQMRAATTRGMVRAALGAVLLPGLLGAADPCSSATAATAGQRVEIRAEDGCAPASARRDDVAAAREYSAATGGDQGSVPLARRSVALRVPDSPPVVKSSWTNTLGAEFVWVPAGKFTMGSPADEAGRQPDEVQHGVTISAGYWMGMHEVTQREWMAVMGFNPSTFSNCESPEGPVDRVSWEGVQEFIRKLNARESGRGYAYRLPTEAEWEYAARAGTTGARYGAVDRIAWYSANSNSSILGWNGPRPVGTKLANAWGLHNMHGNVSEWTADWYGPYPSGSVTDPGGRARDRIG